MRDDVVAQRGFVSRAIIFVQAAGTSKKGGVMRCETTRRGEKNNARGNKENENNARAHARTAMHCSGDNVASPGETNHVDTLYL